MLRFALTLGLFALCLPVAAQPVTVYSYRQPDLIAPLLEAFTLETGLETQTVFLSKGMIERVQAEGAGSPADVFLTSDIGRLIALEQAGVTQPLTDVNLADIPATYQDPDGHWVGLTQRARVFYVSTDLENPPLTYEALADPAYAGMICLRDGQHAYNNALFASFIAHLGEQGARALMVGIRDNLARNPEGNDRAQAKGIYSGECLIGIGNSYYVGLMLTNTQEPEQQEWAAAMTVILPNADDRGTHMNISGAAIAVNAPNLAGATALLDFLTAPAGQEIYAEIVHEYPVSPAASASALVQGFGALRADELPLATLATHLAAASRLVDEIGFNN